MGFIWSGLDESSDRLKRKVFVVAGYLARQAAWTEMERQWMRRLNQERDPHPMQYFKSSECMYLSGEFRRFRDPIKYPRPKGRLAADAIRDDLLQIMRTGEAAGFGLGVNLADYRDVRRSSRARRVLLADPYEEGYLMLMICITGDCEDQMPERRNRETVAFLCDSHERSANVKAVYDTVIEANPKCGHWMGSLTYMDNEASPALQAGDLLASECKAFLFETIDGPNLTREDLIKRWKTRLGGNVSIRCMDKRSLKLLVNANLPKNGKPSICSTKQTMLFDDLLTPADGSSNDKKIRVPKFR